MKKTILIAAGIFIAGFLSAQTVTPELVSSAGEHFENSSYRLDWSIGEPAIETYTNTSYTLTQGFHQNTYTVTEIKSLKFSKIDITAYPNPASDFITIETFDDMLQNTIIELTDMQGRIFLEENYTERKKTINLLNFSEGIYFINVKSNGRIIKSFKIIKN